MAGEGSTEVERVATIDLINCRLDRYRIFSSSTCAFSASSSSSLIDDAEEVDVVKNGILNSPASRRDRKEDKREWFNRSVWDNSRVISSGVTEGTSAISSTLIKMLEGSSTLEMEEDSSTLEMVEDSTLEMVEDSSTLEMLEGS